ncbi:MAG: chromosome segregation protein SMC [Oligoflexales bacterium]
MKLKKIVISGFKSFADKVSLNIDEGITGIIGPNGSGKSNVIDAVRWVMGEQNAKHLRGNVATDIIFSGSDKRKALSVAEVTLIFDNSEYSDFCPPEYRHEPEISLGRRIYADGEREYFINKKPCRLKDIVGFFASTGLGGRSYSMIQQGQVDRVLNAKPEDVREILEEAAGTKVFRARKESAEKKLTTTRENLGRIDDILTELSRQLSTLEGQVETAKKFRELSSELKSEELSLFKHNYAFFLKQIKNYKEDLSSCLEKEAKVLADLSEQEAVHTRLQNELDASDPGMEKLREEVSAAREHIARAESTIASSRQMIETHTARLAQIEAEIANEQTDLESAEKHVDKCENDLRTAQERAEAVKTTVEGLQEEIDKANEAKFVFENRVGEIEDEIRNLDSLLESNRLRFEAIERDRKRAIDQSNIIDSRIGESQDVVNKLEAEVKRTQSILSEKQGGLGSEVAEKRNLEESVRALTEEIRVLQIKKDDVKDKYVNHRARLSSLREIELSSSSVGSALKLLQENEPGLQDYVDGLLVDYISFGDGIEEISAKARNSFEKWAERFVVPNVEGLNALAKAAGRHEVGDITVMVASLLGDIDRAALDKWVDKYDAVGLRAFLKIEKEAPFLGPLLDRIFFLPAVQLEDSDVLDKPHGVIAITANGLIFTDACHFGINSGMGQSLLSRKSELENVEAELKLYEGQLVKIQSELDSKQELVNSQGFTLGDLSKKLEALNQDILTYMRDYQSAAQSYEHKKSLISQELEQKEQHLEIARGYAKELSKLGEARISLGNERETLAEELSSLQGESEDVEGRWEEIKRIYDSRKIELAKEEAKLEGLNSSCQQSRVQLERMQLAVSRRYEEREKINQQIVQANTNEKECENEIKSLLEKREELERELSERRGQNEGLVRELRLIEAQVKTLRDEYTGIKEKANGTNIQVERLHSAIVNIEQQAMEKYQINLSAEPAEEDGSINVASKNKLIEKLRKEIENLGPVNMVAIQEFETLSQRFEFIQNQKEEVVGSIRLLEEAIFEIQETAKEKFLATFQVVNENFKQLFPILFPGGEAFLNLLSEENPLESGVDILVRLPGKKQQPMNLFSGGEKALTAISLIFALLKTKPTPFCFLDEVDAPLDEANVGRYNKVLQALSDKFQFVVITHNRRTMEVLDQLYGITMQEGGVSKVVGVDLKNDLPPHLRKALEKDREAEKKAPVAEPAPTAPDASL